ncbi:DNA (cytosine-5-)-methyltransferase [Flavobacterium yafengii]|uniref:DNA (cytosine-5-)-methyltransferase n=1 Tax=Flavobacterium yafengii TaxID=3041253 RepID=UPI0024A917C4|nr:DNA (cytosine-5-)-methyltransferase [Flavobacterium yafengii]MDI6047040.1 DNA (cytosine-5-)-methyltransferase [Flavobacterium yafengii]
MKYKVGSLYAGVGGICLGFKKAGFDLQWANEIDKNACITYRANFEHKIYEEDIWLLDPNNLKKVDVLTAGFPCQPFSVAGYRKGFNDDRGNHFFRIIDYINALDRPKAVFLENVKNLTGHDKGKTFKIIEQAMRENGYSFHAQVLNSKDFGNIPQNRERIYIVCFKNEEDGTNKYEKYFEFPQSIDLSKKISDILIKDNVEEKFYYREDKYMYQKLKEEMTNKDTVYQWRRQYTRENKSNVCPTLTANMGTGGHNVPLILTENGIRKLTPRECFSFQGYNKDFILPMNVGNSQLYKQAGNSVTVNVIERIAINIMNVFKKVEKQDVKKKQLVNEI